MKWYDILNLLFYNIVSRDVVKNLGGIKALHSNERLSIYFDRDDRANGGDTEKQSADLPEEEILSKTDLSVLRTPPEANSTDRTSDSTPQPED